MKILHVFDHSLPEHTGYTFRSFNILKEQRARGWSTAQMTTPKHTLPSAATESIEGFLLYRTPALPALPAALPGVRDAAVVLAAQTRLAEVARIEQPDIIHAHSPVLNALAALVVGRRLGIPVVYEIRGFWEDAAVDHGTTREGSLRYRAQRALETFAVRHVDAVMAICEGIRGDLIGRGFARERITLIPNAVDVESFEFRGGETRPEDALKAALGLSGCTVLAFIGSYYAYEGLDLLIESLPRMLAKRSDLALLLVGGGPEEEKLKQLADASGVADRIRFVGRVPHGEVARYYDLADLLVYPRHRMRLTDLVTPLKPLEAMARGRIVVASDVGGHRELIQPGRTGWMFRADDPDSLARTVLDALDGRHLWPAMRAAARRFVELERTWRASVSRYEPVYAGVLPQASDLLASP